MYPNFIFIETLVYMHHNMMFNIQMNYINDIFDFFFFFVESKRFRVSKGRFQQMIKLKYKSLNFVF
jgi:hypothetical protein